MFKGEIFQLYFSACWRAFDKTKNDDGYDMKSSVVLWQFLMIKNPGSNPDSGNSFSFFSDFIGPA